MSIVNFSTFRALTGGVPDLLGLPTWPVASMRAGGFDTGFVMTLGVASPFETTITCTEYATDAVAGVDEYDWWFSQGAASGGPFIVSRRDAPPDTSSGSIKLELAPWALALYPDPFDLSAIEVLFFQVSAYVRRRSDGAIQRLDLLSFLRDYLTPKVDTE